MREHGALRQAKPLPKKTGPAPPASPESHNRPATLAEPSARYFDGVLGACVDAAVLCLVDFLVFFCLATFGFAVEVAVEFACVLVEAGGFCGAAAPAPDCAKTAAAVNIVVKIKRFILSLSLAGAF
jgi:hypothetical protein